MENMDLNINNYNLDDILKLFNLKHDFGEEEIKHAKRIALKTHPDKSGLKNDVFIFFSKAYNMLLNVYKFKNKTEKKVINENYNSNSVEVEKNTVLLKERLKGKSRDDFNSWFNKMFDMSHDDKETIGYGDWLKSERDLMKKKANNMNEFDAIFKQKKKESRELVLNNRVQNISYEGVGDFIDKSDVDYSYSSGIFSKLKYEDLKKAHIETVVPVTEEDFTNKKRFNNVEQYLKYREQTKGKVPDKNTSRRILEEENINNETLSANRAYNLLMEDKKQNERNKLWWKNLKLLK
jgi:hypothetical protein